MLRFLPGVPRRCGVDVSVMDTHHPPDRPHRLDGEPVFPGRASAQGLQSEGGDVGHDGVHVELGELAHLLGIIHRPHVDLQAGDVRGGDEPSGDHRDAAVALGDLDGVGPSDYEIGRASCRERV